MKNIKILAGIFLIVTAFTFTSCTNEPIDSAINLDDFGNPTGGVGSSGYYIKVTQDGAAKQWTTTQASYFSLGTGTKSLIIQGANGTTSISLHITNDSGNTVPVAVYPLKWVSIGCGYTEGANIFSSDYSDFNTSAGNITITELNTTNKTVKGTFNFIGKDNAMTSTKVFTNGEFSVKYIDQ